MKSDCPVPQAAPVGSDTALRVRIASKQFRAAEDTGPREVIRDLVLDVERGEFVCLVGPSGCGKTTLLNLIAGLDRDYRGSIEVLADQAGRAPRVGFVFQDPRLLPWRTVAQNIELAVAAAGVDGRHVGELLRTMGVADTLDRYPLHLSVGMQRRVALVRAFAVEPDLLLMDEPLVSLDAQNAGRIRQLLLQTWRRRRATIVFVTHDIGEAVYLADRIVELEAAPGRVRREIAVDLPRERRGDGAEIHRFRQRHFADPGA